jgi:hypothetical protein
LPVSRGKAELNQGELAKYKVAKKKVQKIAAFLAFCITKDPKGMLVLLGFQNSNTQEVLK